MTLKEALLKYGKVKRPNFGEGHYITTNKDGYIVYENDNYITASTLSLRSFVLADDWEEYKEPILDKEEKEQLRIAIEPYRNKIRFLYKKEICKGFAYVIRICLGSNEDGFAYDHMDVVSFTKDKMYKGMTTGKFYKLEDLGL